MKTEIEELNLENNDLVTDNQ